MRQRLTVLTVAVLASLAALSCAGRGRPAGRAGEPPPLVLEPAWSAQLDQGGPLDLAPVPGGFAVVSADGRLRGLDASTGSVAWEARLPSGPRGPAVSFQEVPGVRSEWLALPTAGAVEILDGATGARVASIPLVEGDPPPRLSAVAEGLLLMEAGGDAVLVSPGDGREIWRRPLPSPASAPGAACRGQVVAGLSDGRLAGLSAGSGKLLWTKKLGSPAAARPACDGRHLYVATRDNRLHALRLHRRSAGRMWKVITGADPAAPPLVVEETLLLLSKDTYLYGLKRRNGHLIFRIRLGRRPGPAAVLQELILVSGAQSPRLEAYRLPRGLNAGGFDLPVGSRFVTPPVVSGGTIALAVARFGVTDSSRVIALKPGALKPGAPPPAGGEPGGR